MAAHYQLMVVRTYCTRLLLCCYLRGLQNHLGTQPPTSAPTPAGLAGTSSRLRLYFSIPVCTAPVCLLCSPLSHLSPLNPQNTCEPLSEVRHSWCWSALVMGTFVFESWLRLKFTFREQKDGRTIFLSLLCRPAYLRVSSQAILDS